MMDGSDGDGFGLGEGEGFVVDRRSGLDRREIAAARRRLLGGGDDDGGDGDDAGFDRRRGPGRRRSDFMKSAEEGEMTKEQFLFLMAIDDFKRANGVTFPSWTDVLEVIRLLGYRKTAASEIVVRRGEDWTERGDSASGVRRRKAG